MIVGRVILKYFIRFCCGENDDMNLCLIKRIDKRDQSPTFISVLRIDPGNILKKDNREPVRKREVIVSAQGVLA